MRRFFLSLAICMMALTFSVNSVAADNFSWRGATVYFLVTDRFANGETSNDVNYGRKVDYGSEQMNAATFHGGDLKGILQKAREGYFTQMGIDVLWMTDVYEQLHGWIAGSGKINDFPHYGYHGYYPLDYTQMDKNYGTIEEMRELVNTLHAQGIRVMLGANLNDPGCPTYLDAVQCGYADAFGMNEKQAVEHRRDLDYIKWYGECANWKDWWTRQWIRMNDEGWDQTDPLTMSLYDLPDVKTEKTESVKIPNFLKKNGSARVRATMRGSTHRLANCVKTTNGLHQITWWLGLPRGLRSLESMASDATLWSIHIYLAGVSSMMLAMWLWANGVRLTPRILQPNGQTKSILQEISTTHLSTIRKIMPKLASRAW